MEIEETHAFQLSVGKTTLRWFYRLVSAASGLVILVTLASDLGFAFAQHKLLRLLDLKLEGNVAVWYSSTLLFLTALAALAIATHIPPQIIQRPRYRWVWVLAAIFFAGLSVDETAQLHEAAGRLLTRQVGEVPGLTAGAAPAFGWMIALAPLIVGFLAVMKIAGESLRLHPRSRNLSLAGIGCWIGVLVAEFIQAQLQRLSIERFVQGTVEEGLEVAGTTLFLASFVEFLRYAHSQRSVARSIEAAR